MGAGAEGVSSGNAHRTPRPGAAEQHAASRCEDLAVEREANDAYEAYRGSMKNGRRFGDPPKAYVPPAEPAGNVNTSDPDTKNVSAFHVYVRSSRESSRLPSEALSLKQVSSK
jgi:hypothetical protein